MSAQAQLGLHSCRRCQSAQCTLFFQASQMKGCKIIRETGNELYAFVEFTKYQCAVADLAA